jgi:hypothetical protein
MIYSIRFFIFVHKKKYFWNLFFLNSAFWLLLTFDSHGSQPRPPPQPPFKSLPFFSFSQLPQQLPYTTQGLLWNVWQGAHQGQHVVALCWRGSYIQMPTGGSSLWWRGSCMQMLTGSSLWWRGSYIRMPTGSSPMVKRLFLCKNANR